MVEERDMLEQNKEEQSLGGECSQERVMTTIKLLEKGVKRAFLDDELSVDETKGFLDEVEEAKEACESGNESACIVLARLMGRLTKR